jgi:hypothetical protein
VLNVEVQRDLPSSLQLSQIENPGSFDLIIVIYLVFFLSPQFYLFDGGSFRINKRFERHKIANKIVLAVQEYWYKEVEHSV